MRPYRLQLVQQLKPNDCAVRFRFACEVLQRHNDFLHHVVFSDESTFHTSGKVNTHNVRIWGSENPHQLVQHERDSPKINVFCAVSRRQVYGPFFFAEATVTGVSYLDMLQQWLFPQLVESEPANFIWQQDGAPPHWSLFVRDWLNVEVPDRWIGRHGPDDRVLLPWPPRSPDITPCDFFLWGFVKDRVYVPPLPHDLPTLKGRIAQAVASITPDLLQTVWEELHFRLDVCRITKGAHIEHL